MSTRCRSRQGPPTTIERLNGSPEDVSTDPRDQGDVVRRGGHCHDRARRADASRPPRWRWTARRQATLVLPDSEDESWARIRLDPAAIDEAAGPAPAASTNPVSRAVVWGALRDGLLDARISPGHVSRRRSRRRSPTRPKDLVWAGCSPKPAAPCRARTSTPAHQLRRLESLVDDLLGREPGLAATVSSGQPAAAADQHATSSGCGHGSTVTLLRACWSTPTCDGESSSGCACSARPDGTRSVESSEADPSSQGALAALRCSAALPTVDGQGRDLGPDHQRPREHQQPRPLRALRVVLPRVAAGADPAILRALLQRPAGDDEDPQRLGRGALLHRRLSTVRREPRGSWRLPTAYSATTTLDPFVRRAISDGTDDLRRLRGEPGGLRCGLSREADAPGGTRLRCLARRPAPAVGSARRCRTADPAGTSGLVGGGSGACAGITTSFGERKGSAASMPTAERGRAADHETCR